MENICCYRINAAFRLLLFALFICCSFGHSQARTSNEYSTIALRNSDANGLNIWKIEGVDEPIIMTAANNLTSNNGKWEFVSLGRRKNIEYIQSVPDGDYSAYATMITGNAYIARYPVEYRSLWGTKYCVVAIYCSIMTTDVEHNVIGCKLVYVVDFEPVQKSLTENPFEYGKSVKDSALADWYIVCADSNHNGIISNQEKNAITELSMAYPTTAKGLSSLDALDEFPNLQKISALSSSSTFIKNLPKLTIKHSNLQSIEIDELEVGVLDLSECTGLKSLSLRFAKIGKLILPKSLESLFLQNGTFGNPDMSQVPNLKLCVIQDTDIDEIDLSSCKQLEELRLDSNKLTSLDVSQLTGLIRLSCFGNPMESLDISRNPSIVELNIKGGNNVIKTLYIPNSKTKRDYKGYKTGTFANFSDIDVLNK